MMQSFATLIIVQAIREPNVIPAPFVIPNMLDFDLSFLTDVFHVRDNVSVPEPPGFRFSAPRAPPV